MRTSLLLLCFLLVSCKTPLMGYGDRTGPVYYGNSAKLKPLAETKHDEIRVWVVFLSSVRGTVITQDAYTNYSNRGSNHLKKVSTDKSNGSVFLAKYLPMLAENSKYSFICDTGIHGGAFYHIEGVHNGKYFHTQASWSESCSSPEFDAINEFLDTINKP